MKIERIEGEEEGERNVATDRQKKDKISKNIITGGPCVSRVPVSDAELTLRGPALRRSSAYAVSTFQACRAQEEDTLVTSVSATCIFPCLRHEKYKECLVRFSFAFFTLIQVLCLFQRQMLVLCPFQRQMLVLYPFHREKTS